LEFCGIHVTKLKRGNDSQRNVKEPFENLQGTGRFVPGLHS
jgi:hypothetical protein